MNNSIFDVGFNSTHKDCDDVTLNRMIELILTIFSCAIAVSSVLGNGFIILAVIWSPRLQTPTIYLLCSLAMADFFTGLLVIPVLNIRLVVNIREISHPFSVFSEFIVIQVMAATTFSICAVSLDRFTAIVFSMSYERIVTTRRCLRVILAVWASSLIPALPRIPSQTSLSLRGVLLGALLIIIVFPFSVIAFCYMSIFRAARRHRRQINTNTVSPQPPRQVDKAAVTVAMVILIFLSSWIPILCFSVYELVHTSRVSVCKDLRFRLRFFAFSGLLALGSSVCNPVVYTLRYRRLRKVLKSLLCGWREANRSGN